ESLFFTLRAPPAGLPLFPYTTLFRSCRDAAAPFLRSRSRPRRHARSPWHESSARLPAPRRRPPPASGRRGGARARRARSARSTRSEEHTSELQSLRHLVCRLLLEKKN